jgi:hypothetical protein
MLNVCMDFFLTLGRGIGNVTTLHLESGLTGSPATINMADEGVAGNGKDSGCGVGGLLFKIAFHTYLCIIWKRIRTLTLRTNIF